MELAYNVGISRELINSVNLHVKVRDITIAEEADYAHLIDIDILEQGDEVITDLFNDTVTVTTSSPSLNLSIRWRLKQKGFLKTG